MLFTTTLNIMPNSRRCTVFSLEASKVCQNRFFLQVAEFQRLLEWKLCIWESWSRSSKLFITSFLTSFISTKILYGVIENNCIWFDESKINQLFSLIFKANFTNIFPASGFWNVFVTLLSNERCWCSFYIFFHLKIEFYYITQPSIIKKIQEEHSMYNWVFFLSHFQTQL